MKRFMAGVVAAMVMGVMAETANTVTVTKSTRRMLPASAVAQVELGGVQLWTNGPY